MSTEPRPINANIIKGLTVSNQIYDDSLSYITTYFNYLYGDGFTVNSAFQDNAS